MTWSKPIYPPLHDLLFVHQHSGGQIKSLVGELELKKVVGQDPQAKLLVTEKKEKRSREIGLMQVICVQ